MEIITMTENASFARVKLGNIRPNRFRNLERWPLEQDILDKLKKSITETGFWNNLQAIENEKGEIELRFGHHRLAAGLELFGQDYEVAIEIVPYRGEWNLQRALLMENSIGRNKIMHTHEIIHQLMHWWDDVVFEKYPTWWKLLKANKNNEIQDQAVNFNRLDLEAYFGQQDENGPGHYTQCVKYGIGHEVITKMLAGTEKQSDIKEALTALEPTARRKRGLELKAAEERAKAEAERAEAERIKAEQEAARRKAEQEAKERQAELDRITEEQRQIAAAAKKAKEAEEQKRLNEQAEQRARDLEAKKKAAVELHELAQREHKERQKSVKEKEDNAMRSEIRAKQKEQALERREWYDARASEVFGAIPSHGRAFRQAVSQESVQPYLDTENLLPFAKAIQAKYGDSLTSEKILYEVNNNFREFKKTLKLREKEIIDVEERDNPEAKVLRFAKEAGQALSQAADKINALVSVLKELKITKASGVGVEAFLNGRAKIERALNGFDNLSNSVGK